MNKRHAAAIRILLSRSSAWYPRLSVFLHTHKHYSWESRIRTKYILGMLNRERHSLLRLISAMKKEREQSCNKLDIGCWTAKDTNAEVKEREGWRNSCKWLRAVSVWEILHYVWTSGKLKLYGPDHEEARGQIFKEPQRGEQVPDLVTAYSPSWKPWSESQRDASLDCTTTAEKKKKKKKKHVVRISIFKINPPNSFSSSQSQKVIFAEYSANWRCSNLSSLMKKNMRKTILNLSIFIYDMQ